MPSISEIYIGLGVDLSEFRRRTREAGAIAGATAAKVSDALSSVRINPRSFTQLTREMDRLKGRSAELRQQMATAEPRSAAWGKLAGELRGVESRMRTLGPIADDLKRKNEALAASFGRIGDGLLRAGAVGGAALAASGIAGYRAWEAVDAGLDNVAKQTGAVGQELTGLKDVFRSVARRSVQSLAEVGDAVGTIATISPMRGAALEQFAAQVLDLARLTNTSATGIAAAATRAFNAYGVAANEAAPSLDALYAVSQSTGVGITELTGAIQQSGPALRALGLGFDTSAALVGSLSKAGLDAQRVLQPLARGVAAMLKEGAADPGQAFVMLADRIRRAKTDADATRGALKVFGTRGGLPIAEAIRRGAFDVQAFVRALDKAPNSIANTTKATDDAQEAFARLRNATQIVIAPVGSRAIAELSAAAGRLSERFTELQQSGRLEPLLQSLGNAASGAVRVFESLVNAAVRVAEWFSRLSPATQQWVSRLALVSPVLLLVAGGVAKLVQGLILLRTSIAAVRTASLLASLQALATGATGGAVAVGGLTAALNTLRATFLTPLSGLGLFAGVIAGATAAGLAIGAVIDQLAEVNRRATDANIAAAQLATQTMRRQKDVAGVIAQAGGAQQYAQKAAQVSQMARQRGVQIAPGTTHTYVQRMMATGDPFARQAPRTPPPAVAPKPVAAVPTAPAGGARAAAASAEPAYDPSRDKPPVAELRAARTVSSADRRRIEQEARDATSEEQRMRLAAELAVVRQQAKYAEENYRTRLYYAGRIASKVTEAERETARAYRDAHMTELEALQRAKLADIRTATDAEIAAAQRVKAAREDAYRLADVIAEGVQQERARRGDVVATALSTAGEAFAQVMGSASGELVRVQMALQSAAVEGATRLREAQDEGTRAIESAVQQKAAVTGEDPAELLRRMTAAAAAGKAPDWFKVPLQQLENMRAQVEGDVWKKRVELDTARMKAQLTLARDLLIANVQGLTGNNEQYRIGYEAGVKAGYDKALREAKLNVGAMESIRLQLPSLVPPKQAPARRAGQDDFTAALARMPGMPPVAAASSPAPSDTVASFVAPVASALAGVRSVLVDILAALTGRRVQPVEIVAPLPVPVVLSQPTAPVGDAAAVVAQNATATEQAPPPVAPPVAQAAVPLPADAPVFGDPADRLERDRTHALLADNPPPEYRLTATPEGPQPAPPALPTEAPPPARMPVTVIPATEQGMPDDVDMFADRVAPPRVMVQAPPAPVAANVATPVPVAAVPPTPTPVSFAAPPPQSAAVAPAAQVAVVEPAPPYAGAAVLPVPAAVEASPPALPAAARLPLDEWAAFVAQLRAGVTALLDSARQFAVTTGAAMAVPLPQPAVAGIAPDVVAAQSAIPQAPAAVAPAISPQTASIAGEHRVVIEVLPSPLFDVRQRQVVLGVLREDKLRAGMGVTGLADREGRR